MKWKTILFPAALLLAGLIGVLLLWNIQRRAGQWSKSFRRCGKRDLPLLPSARWKPPGTT